MHFFGCLVLACTLAAGEVTVAEDLLTLPFVAAALARLLEEPGAAHRLAEFQAATRGILRHLPRPTEE